MPVSKNVMISITIPRQLIERANETIPVGKRSRIIAGLLSFYLAKKAQENREEQYKAFYSDLSVQKEIAEIEKDFEYSDTELNKYLND